MMSKETLYFVIIACFTLKYIVFYYIGDTIISINKKKDDRSVYIKQGLWHLVIIIIFLLESLLVGDIYTHFGM